MDLPFHVPGSLDLMRLLVLIGSWAIIPLHLWTFWRVMGQIQEWREAEDSRIARWREDMATSARLLQECENLRHQAEVSLALARQSHARNAAPSIGQA